jgi:hypothetical protein
MILNLEEKNRKSIIAIVAEMIIFIHHLLNQHLKNYLYGKIKFIRRFLLTYIRELFIYYLKKQLL